MAAAAGKEQAAGRQACNTDQSGSIRRGTGPPIYSDDCFLYGWWFTQSRQSTGRSRSSRRSGSVGLSDSVWGWLKNHRYGWWIGCYQQSHGGHGTFKVSAASAWVKPAKRADWRHPWLAIRFKCDQQRMAVWLDTARLEDFWRQAGR